MQKHKKTAKRKKARLALLRIHLTPASRDNFRISCRCDRRFRVEKVKEDETWQDEANEAWSRWDHRDMQARHSEWWGPMSRTKEATHRHDQMFEYQSISVAHPMAGLAADHINNICTTGRAWLIARSHMDHHDRSQSRQNP